MDGASDERALCFLCVPLSRKGIWCGIQEDARIEKFERGEKTPTPKISADYQENGLFFWGPISSLLRTENGLTTDILVVKYTGRGLVVRRPGVLSKVQMLNLVLGVGVFSLLPKNGAPWDELKNGCGRVRAVPSTRESHVCVPGPRSPGIVSLIRPRIQFTCMSNNLRRSQLCNAY